MASVFTPNVGFQEPATGDQVGTWGSLTVNPNMTLADLIVGGNATISLNNSNVILSAAQYQCRMITFNSTLTGSVTITFPTSFIKDYMVYHACSGSSAFTITLETTATGGQVVAIPPGEATQVYSDGTNLKFLNLGRVGQYMDYAGSSVPAWVSGCTIPPYLACTGVSISSATYPVLFGLCGSATPDLRGRTKYSLDGGTGRITGVLSGGNTIFTGGGDQNMQSHNHSISDPSHTHGTNAQTANGQIGGATGGSVISAGNAATINAAVTGITINSAGSGGSQNLPPLLVTGLTLIRAA